ncbi:MAG: hypothetical protein AB7G75_16980 [Candidatus Binatia bacterium]
MRKRILLVSCAMLVSLVLPPAMWAGGAGNGVPAVRESLLLPHICTDGPNEGLPCTVRWTGGDPFAVVSDNCPGACVIDYEGEPFEGDFFVMVDEDVAAPSNPEAVLEVPIVTALLCVEKKKDRPMLITVDKRKGKKEEKEKKTQHCFTESYQPDGSSFSFGSVGIFLSNPRSPEDQLVSSAEEGLADTAPGRETMLRFWKFGLSGVLTPDSDLTQALRDLYEKTGVVTVTDIHRIGTDDHVEDTTGSVLRFRITLQFVKAPLVGP